jgi:hypothetical protein
VMTEVNPHCTRLPRTGSECERGLDVSA